VAPDLRHDEGTVLLVDEAFQGGGCGDVVVHWEWMFDSIMVVVVDCHLGELGCIMRKY
jgi:hypothetical protein